MDLNTLISQYGYAALVIGSLAEGETVKMCIRDSGNRIVNVQPKPGAHDAEDGKDDVAEKFMRQTNRDLH